MDDELDIGGVPLSGSGKGGVDEDGNPFTGDSGALAEDEGRLADFVVHESREERIDSFVEEFEDTYRESPEQVATMLRDIYVDLETQSPIEDAEGEIAEVLERLEEGSL